MNAPINDEVFVRRIFLDLAGRVPSLSEDRDFLDGIYAAKRGRLIDSLPAYESQREGQGRDRNEQLLKIRNRLEVEVGTDKVALRAAVEEELKKLRVSDEKPEKKGKGDDSLKLVTCYEMRSTIRHPGIGAWLLKYKGRLNENLPGSVCIAGGSRVIGGAGFFESAFEPLAIGDPESGLRNSKITPGITGERFDSRLSLANDLDQEFRARYDLKRVRAYALMFDGSAS